MLKAKPNSNEKQEEKEEEKERRKIYIIEIYEI